MIENIESKVGDIYYRTGGPTINPLRFDGQKWRKMRGPRAWHMKWKYRRAVAWGHRQNKKRAR